MTATVLKLNDIELVMSVTSELYESSSAPNRFILGKSPEMIATLRKHLEGKTVRNIVDLGIYKGGSCVLYNELFNPAKLVAIDCQKDEVVPLRNYLDARNAADTVKLYYKTDQSDRAALGRLYDTEFGSELLDLVVDDASHIYEQTKASFNFFFPRVRPEGLYVIEDWGWSHWPGEEWQKPDGFFAGRTPLSILVFEIAMTCASMQEGAVKSMHLTGNSVYIERGHRPLDDSFDIGRSYLSQGRPWGPQRLAAFSRIQRAIGSAKRWTRRLSTLGHKPGVTRGLTGLWWNPDESGWGIYFSQRANIVFVAWSTYDSVGNPKWYVAPHCALPAAAPSGSCTGFLYEVNGPIFFGTAFNPSAAKVTTVGSLTLSFMNANAGSMTYTVARQTRTVPITRQPFPTGSAPPPVDYTDLWWNPSESGWGLSITHQFNVMFLGWYVYDSAGNPVWYVAPSCNVNFSQNGCTGTLYRTTGPPFGPTFDSSQVQAFAAGTVSVSFSDSNNGTLSYIVNGVSIAKTITRQLF